MRFGDVCSVDRCDRNLDKLRERFPYGSPGGRAFYLAMLSVLASTTDEEIWDQALKIAAGVLTAGNPVEKSRARNTADSQTEESR